MKKNITIIASMIVLGILFLTIGYSSFNDNLVISDNVGYVRADVEVRITGVSTSSGYVSNLNFNTKSIINTVSIPAGESITYTVDARNLGNVPVAVSGVTFTSGGNNVSDLSANITSNNYVKICNNTVCTINALKTFDVTITNNGSSMVDTDLDINLIFTEVYTIIYNDNVVGEVLSGGTFEYTVDSNISSVTKTSGTGTLDVSNLPNIIISGVGSNIVLTGSATTSLGIGYLTIQNISTNPPSNDGLSCDYSLREDDTTDKNLRYVGSSPCNYIYFNNANWRIVGVFQIDGEHLIKIMNPTAYSTSTKFNSSNANGYQLWTKNSLSTELNSTYYNQIVTNGYDSFIKQVKWNVGGPANNQNTPKNFYAAEIASKSATAVNIGLLNISDYAYATTGPTNGNVSTCLNATMNSWGSVDCVSNNAIVNDWLFSGSNEWTIDALSNRAQVYRMQSNGIPYTQGLNNSSTSTRPAVYLKENVKFDSGDGSSNSPYHISLSS